MHELAVSGTMKTIGFREGSSGIFTGTIEGLYQGYRFASTEPDERELVIEAPHGTLALLLRQEIVSALPPRPNDHPFADGQDPLAEARAAGPAGPGPPGGRPPGAGPPGGGPPGAGPPGGGPPGAGPPGGGPPGGGPPDMFKRFHHMDVKLRVDPERSTGIFDGATGEAEIEAPNYKFGGYLVVNTDDGDLRLDFLEEGKMGRLDADLSVDGENSTGIYQNARGELTFSLEVIPPLGAEGPYSGTIWLEQPPPSS
jgi:hypothetical protein